MYHGEIDTTIPDWLKDHFPTNRKDAQNWTSINIQYALHRNVLCVATTRIEGAWCAYCKDVAGQDHKAEQNDVLAHGDKISDRVARVMFPQFEGVPYAY